MHVPSDSSGRSNSNGNITTVLMTDTRASPTPLYSLSHSHTRGSRSSRSVMDSEEGDYVEQEAEESSADEEDDSEDSEEDEEGEEEGDIADLINDNPDVEEEEEEEEEGGEESGEEVEEGGGEGEGEKKRKGKRKRRVDDQLDEDDLELIKENTGVDIQVKKQRRAHFESDDEEEGEGREEGGRVEEERAAMRNREISQVFGGDSDEEELPSTGLSVRQGGEGISRRDSDEEEDAEEAPRDDLEDFIVGDDGRPISINRPGGMESEPALLEAQEIFGLEFDPTEFDQVAREGLGSEDEEEENDYLSGEEEDEEGEDEEEGGSQRKRRRKRKAKKKTSIYDVYEPSELERGFFTERDNDIRVTDIPERFQTRSVPVQKTEEGELDEEAEWIFENIFSKPPVSKQPLCFSQKPRAPVRGSSGASYYSKAPSAVPKIKEALNFMRNHSFEVPFIANYRKEYVEPELDVHDLWTIWQSDEKWMQLKQRKGQMVGLFERLQDYQFEKVREEPDKALTEDTRPLTEDDITRLKAVKTPEELSDVYAQFSLYYGRDLVEMQHRKTAQKRRGDTENQDMEIMDGLETNKSKKKTAVKQAHRKTYYVVCQEAGLGSLAAKFGLTPEQFGENLRDNYQRHETEQHSVEPEEVAQDYVQHTGVFTSARKVLQGACHMVAMQLATEPLVRQAVRQVFQTRALLTVKPTKKGKKMIDDVHPCAGMKYLRNKPIKDLSGADFLRLVQAEGDGLVEIRISIDLEQSAQDKRGGSAPQTYFEEIRQLFYRDEFSRLVEKWNAQRAQAVYSALVRFLYPLMQKELHTTLLHEAKEHVLRSCVQTFRGWLDMAPLCPKREDDEDSYLSHEEGPFARVVAVAFGSDKTVPAFCCYLDSNGEVADYRRLTNLLKRRISPSERERNEKEKDLESFKDFVSRKRPEAIALAAESRDALMLVDDLHNALVELEGEEGVPVVPVELVNPNVAKIFSKSPRAKESFPEYPELLCEAVSLGRRLQDPLTEFTALANAENDELLALQMELLQSSLDPDELRACLEIELVTRVNDVGVDVNFCLEHPHAIGMLAYVCGLGPRKALFLLKILKQENSQLQNRSQLVTQCSTGPQVFINCAGFIRIDTNAFSDADNTYIEVLDSTRVHPETYEWARKMAVDALEYDETGDESHPSAAVEDILLTPDKLRDLDLDAFAEELERQDYGNKRTTLYDIRDELFSPYKERRKPHESMSPEEKFNLITGETPESLFKGKLVTCTVVGIVRRKPPREVLDRANPIENKNTAYWQCPFCLKDDFRELSMVWQHFDDGSCPGQGIGVRARLENGLSGFIHTKNLSDSQVNAPEERVHIGMTIHARILNVNVEKFSVDLTCRSSDLKDTEGRFSVPKDVYFDKQAADADQKKEDATRKHPKQRYIQRVIVHPAFLNASFAEVEKELAKMDLGEAIFRPSSKGTDHLTVTWKVEEDILHHIDIREQGKPNQFSLGKSLWIGNDEYEDLDEILARYIQPMAALARDIITHKVYRAASGGDRKTLEKLLSDERKKNPKRIPYFFSASKKTPGKFSLAYQPGIKPIIEYFSLTPDGYRYRGKVHSSVNDLIAWFKGHYRDPIPRPVPTSQVMPPPQTSHYHTPQQHSAVPSPISSTHGSRAGGNTPYTPQWPTATPPPSNYGSHQASYSQPPQQPYGYAGGYQQQQYRGGTTGAPSYGGSYQGGYQDRGGGGGGWAHHQSWVAAQSYSRTPGQTPGRTPAYTPTQTPGSYMGSLTGTPHSARTSHPRHTPASPLGTPILDE